MTMPGVTVELGTMIGGPGAGNVVAGNVKLNGLL